MSGRRNYRETKMCCACQGKPRFQYGRCKSCFRDLGPALFKHLQSLTRTERAVEFEKITGQPERPRWEWPGDEATLAEANEIEAESVEAAGEKR
jgi:hypothetical protein